MRSFKNKVKGFKAYSYLVAFLFASLLLIPTFSKKSSALEVVIPTPQFNATPITYMCIFPGSFTAGVTSLATGVGTAIASTASQIAPILTGEPTATELSLSSAILNTHTKNIIDKFTELWVGTGKLKDILSDMTSQITTKEAAQERVIGSLMDAAEQNKAIRRMQKSEIDANRSSRASEGLQMVATIIGGLQRSKNIQQGYNLASAQILMERTAAKSGSENPGGSQAVEDHSKGAHADIGKRWDKYVAKYCNKDFNAGNAGCTNNGTMEGKDINIADTIFSRETIEYADQDVADAVNELIINIAEPFMPNAFPPQIHKTAPGKEAILESEAYKSRRQVVYDAINHVVSRRLPGSQTGDYMENLRMDVGINAESLSSVAGYNPSYNEVMHFMTSERFRTGNYSVEQIDEPENNARERVVQSALFLMQLNDMADLLDKQAMLLTAQVNESVRDAAGIMGSSIDLQDTE